MQHQSTFSPSFPIPESLESSLQNWTATVAWAPFDHAIKADEEGLIALADKLGKPYQTWDKTGLSEMEPLLSTRSDYVFKTVGVYGVAESAALLSAQQQTGQAPELILNKQKTRKATCAIARSYSGVGSATCAKN